MPEVGPQTDRPRSIWRSLGRGTLCRCPNCGEGRLFHGDLDQVALCAKCGEPLEKYNAGLLLPLAVGLLGVLLFAVIFLVVELNGGVSPGSYRAILLPTSAIVSLAALRPCKGALIGLMWALDASDELER